MENIENLIPIAILAIALAIGFEIADRCLKRIAWWGINLMTCGALDDE